MAYTKPMIFAHTGVTQYAPENTLEAFKKSAELGYEGIELDINVAGDGEIMVIHNDNLEYMTNGADCRFLKDMTADEIKKVNIPYRNSLKVKTPPVPWTEEAGGRKHRNRADEPEDRVTHIITFEEFDKWLETVAGEMTVEVEFKALNMLDRMDEILAKSKNVSRYIFFSGEFDILKEIQHHYREKGKPDGLRFGANIRFINEETMKFVNGADLWEVGLNDGAFIKEDVDMLNRKGIKVFSNLGDYTEWWSKLAPYGVTGFKTNYPEAYTKFIG